MDNKCFDELDCHNEYSGSEIQHLPHVLANSDIGWTISVSWLEYWLGNYLVNQSWSGTLSLWFDNRFSGCFFFHLDLLDEEAENWMKLPSDKNSVFVQEWVARTLNMAASGEPSSMKGGFPVAISTMVQPSDQMSAGAP